MNTPQRSFPTGRDTLGWRKVFGLSYSNNAIEWYQVSTGGLHNTFAMGFRWHR